RLLGRPVPHQGRRLGDDGSHLAGRSDQARLPGRAVPGRARGPAQGLQLLRLPTRQPRGDGARDVRERPAAQSARSRLGGDLDGENPDSLGLDGREEFAVEGVENGEASEVTVRADENEFRARVRLDTPREREYLQHGGILRYVLRRLLSS